MGPGKLSCLAIPQLVVLFLTSSVAAELKLNNVCSTYSSYFYKDFSSNCHYNPSLYKNVTDVLDIYIGSSETHEVTTEDGYILGIFRIPLPQGQKSKGVIILQQPLFVDSGIWTNQGNDSNAFFFSRAGYDVWLPNNRGTVYSSKHVNQSLTQEEYWDWSFYEMGIYDHPAVFNYIRNYTGGGKMIFIGHSMATTSSLIYQALKPEEAEESFDVMIQMAPVANLKYLTSPIKYVSYVLPLVEAFTDIFGIYGIIFKNTLFLKIFELIVIPFPAKFLFELIICAFTGWTLEQYDPTYWNIMVSIYPDNVSWKTMYHYGQMVRSGGLFQQYDYGKQKNLQKYGSEQPPLIPVGNITTPNYLVYSTSDTLSYSKDVTTLNNTLQSIAKPYGELELSGFNHIDHHYGKQRVQKIYTPILNFLESTFGQ